MENEENYNEEESPQDPQSVEDELKSIKDEMKELREMMKDRKRSEPSDDEDEDDLGFKIHFDDDAGYEGIDDTISDYMENVMAGVADNIRRSMEQMTRGFTMAGPDLKSIGKEFKHIGKEYKHAARGLEREKHRIKRDAQKAVRKAQKAAKKAGRTYRYQPLSEEELEEFYSIAPNLASALSDEKKLRLLKELEKGPKYQGDLSEATNIKGGTFKHHLDSLLENRYVYQETTRGRYLITQLGVEALKLTEMLFRRYYMVTNQADIMMSEEEDEELDEEFEDIKEEIDDAVDRMDDLQDAAEDISDNIEDTAEDFSENMRESFEDPL